MHALLARLQILHLERERGQTMAEYVIVLGVISVTILLALGALSGSIGGELGRVARDI